MYNDTACYTFELRPFGGHKTTNTESKPDSNLAEPITQDKLKSD